MSLCRFWVFGFGAALLVIVDGGCHEPSATQPDALAQVPATTVETPVASAPTSSAASRSRPTGSQPDAGSAVPLAASGSAAAPTAGLAPAAPDSTPEGESPALLDAGGKALNQTEERPTTSSASFQRRVEAVARAIISGDPEPALVAFFPLVAYQQVKDVAKPERDYKFRLLANFKRDVLEYHHALGASAAGAKFDGVAISEKDAKWMAPGSEGNKVGYFRVLRARLRFTLPTGRSRDFELTSLISWRGEWYVVHLHGFK